MDKKTFDAELMIQCKGWQGFASIDLEYCKIEKGKNGYKIVYFCSYCQKRHKVLVGSEKKK